MSTEEKIPCSRIYFSNLLPLINRKDKRSARKWCRDNNLSVYRDSSGEFVYKAEFDLAYDMPLINALQIKYPETWKDFYRLYRNGNAFETINFSNIASQIKSYIPKGNLAKSFERSWK